MFRIKRLSIMTKTTTAMPMAAYSPAFKVRPFKISVNVFLAFPSELLKWHINSPYPLPLKLEVTLKIRSVLELPEYILIPSLIADPYI